MSVLSLNVESLFSSFSLNSTGGGCAFCQSVEHYKRDCPENPGNKRAADKGKNVIEIVHSFPQMCFKLKSKVNSNLLANFESFIGHSSSNFE